MDFLHFSRVNNQANYSQINRLITTKVGYPIPSRISRDCVLKSMMVPIQTVQHIFLFDYIAFQFVQHKHFHNHINLFVSLLSLFNFTGIIISGKNTLNTVLNTPIPVLK